MSVLTYSPGNKLNYQPPKVSLGVFVLLLWWENITLDMKATVSSNIWVHNALLLTTSTVLYSKYLELTLFFCRIITFHTLKKNTSYSLPLPPGNHHSIACFHTFDYVRGPIRRIMQYFSFYDWLTSLSIMPDRSIHVVTSIYSLVLMWGDHLQWLLASTRWTKQYLIKNERLKFSFSISMRTRRNWAGGGGERNHIITLGDINFHLNSHEWGHYFQNLKQL